MSRNGSGTYTLPAGNPVVTGTTISSTWANNTLSDIATALTGSIASDGQTTPSANLPMGGYNHTNVNVATARNQYASAGQVEDGTLNYLTTVSGTNTITATAPVSMSAYVAGQVFRFIAAGANTGAVTLNLNSIGAKSLVKTDGSALVSGDIASGAAVQVMYDGTNFQLLSDANGATETVTTLTATTKVVTPQIGSSSGAFTIQSANTTAVTVDSSQNVGIGTASPVNYGSNYKTVTINGATTGVLDIQANGTTQLELSTGTNYAQISAIGASGVLAFTTAGNTERMRIDSSGNVGIGTASPGYALDVLRSTTGASANFSNSSSYGQIFITSGGTNQSSYLSFTPTGTGKGVFQVSNGDVMTLDSSGNVGIGTSSPSVQLQATKPVLFDSSGVGVANSVAVGVGSSSTGLFWITGNSLGISTNGAERMRIDSSGKVGIGTSSPDRKLTVSMDVTDDNVILAKSAASNSYIGFADNGTSSQTGLSVRMGSAGNAMIFQTGGTTERMRIDSSGNVLVNSNTLYQYQPAPTSKSTTATLTGAELITGILNTTGTTYTVTLPTGTNIDAAVSSSLGVNGCFDWFVINTASGTITIGANGNTTLGTLTIATGVSAQFRFRKTAANTYTVYRMG